MKRKQAFILSAALLACGALRAQNYVIADFENGNVSFTDEVNVNPPSSGQFEVVDNPATNEVNATAKCWKYTRLTAGENWAGFYCSLKEPFNTSGYKYLHVKYYRANEASQLRVTFEGNGFKQEFLPMADHAPQATGQWKHLVFDLAASGVADKEVTVFGLQPDFCSPNTANTVVYVDEIMLSTSITGESGFSSYLPKDLAVGNVQQTSLDLTWATLQEAASYDIYQDNVLVGNTAATSYQVTGLEEFEVYQFHIVARNASDAQSQASSPVYVQTQESKEHKDARMAWWREARFGMFIHWGGYAAFAGHYEGKTAAGDDIVYDSAGGGNGGYAEWIMFGAQIPRDVYKARIASDFTAENYDPKEWVRMAKEAGMKYIIITSKHHEGLAMFDTHVGWNVIDHSPAKRDLMRGLVDAAREAGLKIGFYYSQSLDWMNPGGMDWMPQNNNGHGGEWPYEDQKKYVNDLVIPHLNTILNEYKIDVMWFDMGQNKYPDLQYATLKAIKDNPNSANIIYNDRLYFNIDNGQSGDHGTPEQSIPDVPMTGRADGRDWETCMTMNVNWGYCAKDQNWKPTSDLLNKLIDIASKGGNFLLNIGPKADGTFPQESIDRLDTIGQWMKVNGEAIYGTVANPFPKALPWGKTTRKVADDGSTTLYLHVADWPADGTLALTQLGNLPQAVTVLGLPDAAPTAELENGSVVIKGLPDTPQNEYSTTIKLTFEGDLEVVEEYVQPDADGVLTLLPDDAMVEGICQEGDPDMRNLGCWPAENIIGPVEGKWAEWNIYVPRTGQYAVSAWFGAEQAGVLNIAIDGTPTADLDYPHGTDYHTEQLGFINLTEGQHKLRLTRTSTTATWNYINLLNLVLVPQPGSGTGNIIPTADRVQVFASQGQIRLAGLAPGDLVSLYDTWGRCLLTRAATAPTDCLAVSARGMLAIQVAAGNGDLHTTKVVL